MIKFFTEYWFIIFSTLVGLALLTFGFYLFINKSAAERLKKIKEWLLYAVAEAEKQFGSKTGQLKLHYVYNMFITKFPFISKFMSFKTFSKLVDTVLEKFRNLLESNKAIKDYIDSEE